MKIVGITGQAGSGKDAVAEYLVTQHDFIQIALADPIKRFGYHVFDFSEEQLWGPSEHRNNVDDRYNFSFKWDEAFKRLQNFASSWVANLLIIEKDVSIEVKSLFDWFNSFRFEHKRKELSPRIVLQHLGTEWGRQTINNDIWIRNLLAMAADVLNGSSYDRLNGLGELVCDEGGIVRPPGVVVSDVRFENELKEIKDVDGKIFKILRPGTDFKAVEIGIKRHASEEEQKNFSTEMFDAVIKNDKSLNDLYDTVDTLISTI